MTLADFVDDVAARRKSLAVYAPDGAPDVAAQFDTRNVAVERERLPPGGPDGFTVLREDGEFVAAFGLAELAALLSPPLVRPWDREELPRPWRSLYEALDNTLFASFDRRQLLAGAREIEDRAWRIGAGTLRVGFQRPAAYRDQEGFYRRLATETDLSIHAYVDDGWDVPAIPGITLHRRADPEIGRYWFLVFGAGGDPLNASALLAEERSPGSFYGFWTYDADTVDRLATYLEGIAE